MLTKRRQTGRYGRYLKGGCKITIADKWFSRFVRIRDAKVVQLDGLAFGNCITCNRYFNIKDLECGHYITREKPLTRFHEKNCHAQCHYCNDQRKGEQAKHAFKINSLYGPGTAEDLMSLGSIRGGKHHTAEALKDITTEYRLKTNELLKQKKIKKWW